MIAQAREKIIKVLSLILPLKVVIFRHYKIIIHTLLLSVRKGKEMRKTSWLDSLVTGRWKTGHGETEKVMSFPLKIFTNFSSSSGSQALC